MNPNNHTPAVNSGEGSQLEHLTRWLIQHAARTAPTALSERLEEEWLAHLATLRGAGARLRFAIGCCWARRVIAHDFLASGTPATGSASGHGIIALGQYDPYYFSRRTTILLLIVGFHAIVIYGFVTGFGSKVFAVIPGPMLGHIVDSPRTQEPLPPPPPIWHLPTPAPVVPEVSPTVDFASEPLKDTVITQPVTPSIPAAAPPRQVQRILGGPGAAFPNTDDYYPLAARRLGQMGVATVRVCVDGRGRLTSTPTLAQSSAWTLLDGAALQLAKAGTGHYRSTTEDGVAVSSCYPFRIRFRLRQ